MKNVTVKYQTFFLILSERPSYLFSSMHQGCGAILLSPIHPHPLLDQQPEDVVLPPRCCQHAQGHTTDILQTNRQRQSYNVRRRGQNYQLLTDLLWMWITAKKGDSLKLKPNFLNKVFEFCHFLWPPDGSAAFLRSHWYISDKVHTVHGQIKLDYKSITVEEIPCGAFPLQPIWRCVFNTAPHPNSHCALPPHSIIEKATTMLHYFGVKHI